MFYRNDRIDQCIDLQGKGGRGVVIYVQNLLGEGTVFEFRDNGFLRSTYGRKTMTIITKREERREKREERREKREEKREKRREREREREKLFV